MRNLFILLTGLLLFSLLGYFCIYKNHARSIQDDIHERSNRLLRSDMPETNIMANVDGRDVVLTGNVTTQALKDRAESVAKVVGSRVVENKLVVDTEVANKLQNEKAALAEPVNSIPEVEAIDVTKASLKAPLTKMMNMSADSADANHLPYRFIATLSENKKILLKGDVPNEDARKQVVDLVNKLFAGSEISDRLVESKNTSKDWLITVRSMLTNLALLESGSAELVDDIMSMTGKAKTHEIEEKITIDVSKQMSQQHQGLFNITVLNDPEIVPNPLVVNQQGMACQQQFKQLLSDNIIRFRLSRAVVSAESMNVLVSLANIAKSCPGQSIQIEGHTDSTGADAHNKWLSQSRADAVLQHLVKLGVDKARLRAIGYGDSKPIANNATALGRAKNRRIEFTVQEVK